MALDSTVAGTTADSYVEDTDEADAILLWKANSKWTGSTVAVREAVLKEAAKVLDRLPTRFTKSAEAQSMQYPYAGMTNSSGTLIIHERIKRAQCYLALHLLQNPNLFSGGDDDVKQVSVSGSFSVTFGGTGTKNSIPEDVMNEMKPYLWVYGPGVGKAWSSSRRAWI